LIIVIILGEEYKSRSSSLCNFLHSPVTSYLFGPNILLSTLLSKTLSLCTSLNVRDQVSHPYRNTGKIIIWNILIFMLFDSRREDGSFWSEWWQHKCCILLLIVVDLLGAHNVKRDGNIVIGSDSGSG
jgi:hypothetical protein